MQSVVRDAEGIKKSVVPLRPGQAVFDVPLFRSSELFILNATLPPHFRTPPHDHRMWAVVGIYDGQENNTFYRRSGRGLEEVNRREVHAGGAILLGPDVIHAIENPCGSNTLGLHVYGGDLLAAGRSMWNPHSGEELPYDIPQLLAWCKESAGRRDG